MKNTFGYFFLFFVSFFLVNKLSFFSFWAHFRVNFTFDVAGYSNKQSMFYRVGALPLQPRVNKQTGVDLLGKLKVFFFFFFTQNLLPVAALCEDFKLMKVAPFKALEKKVLEKTQSVPLSVMKKLPASCFCGRRSNNHCRGKIQEGWPPAGYRRSIWLLGFCSFIYFFGQNKPNTASTWQQSRLNTFKSSWEEKSKCLLLLGNERLPYRL